MSYVEVNDTQLPIEELHLSFLVHKLRTEFGFMESSRQNIPYNSDMDIIPLYTYPCYEYLNSLNLKGKRVFEYGCGYSTIWWKNQDAITSGVESDPKWWNLVSSQVEGVELQTHKQSYIDSILQYDEKFDFIIIDGKFRSECVANALTMLSDDGMIILDNSDFFESAKVELDAAQNLIPIHFHGFKPIHVETETTSCYISRSFDQTPRTVLPMGGTQRTKV